MYGATTADEKRSLLGNNSPIEVNKPANAKQYEQKPDVDSDTWVYTYEKDVSVMIFIGFGFLMTFLKKAGYQAIGYTLLISVFVIQWTILCIGWFRQYSGVNGNNDKIQLNEEYLAQGQFGAAAVMITFGALIGKVSPNQMMVLAVFEVFFYALNTYIGEMYLNAADVGGSIFIHSFGAFFGLAAAMKLSPDPKQKSYVENSTSYHSDLFSLIGTIFLWVYWPSFNACVAPADQRQVITLNTVLALTGSTLAAFYASKSWRGEGKFDPVDIQNATLAGGVAIGAVSNFLITPAGAMFIGALAGLVSVAGYVWISDYFNDKIGLEDTCGVLCLHGLPGLIGYVSSIIVTSYDVEYAGSHHEYANGNSQAYTQFLGGAITLGIALVSGYVCGGIVNATIVGENNLFTDEAAWFVPTTNVLTFSQEDTNEDIKRAIPARQKKFIALARWQLIKRSIGTKKDMQKLVFATLHKQKLNKLKGN